MTLNFLINILKHLIVDHISLDTNPDNPYCDDDTTTVQNEQIETFHDPQGIFNDAHQILMNF